MVLDTGAAGVLDLGAPEPHTRRDVDLSGRRSCGVPDVQVMWRFAPALKCSSACPVAVEVGGRAPSMS